MQIGQNSISPESSLPQLGQVRWGSVLMDLTALWPRSEPKTTAGRSVFTFYSGPKEEVVDGKWTVPPGAAGELTYARLRPKSSLHVLDVMYRCDTAFSTSAVE